MFLTEGAPPRPPRRARRRASPTAQVKPANEKTRGMLRKYADKVTAPPDGQAGSAGGPVARGPDARQGWATGGRPRSLRG
jgi:hypothetical protein